MTQETRVAVVTGGRQGIGKRTVEVLAGRGYNVAIIDMQDSTAVVNAVCWQQAKQRVFEMRRAVLIEAQTRRFSDSANEQVRRA